jgi:hypothetical protein
MGGQRLPRVMRGNLPVRMIGWDVLRAFEASWLLTGAKIPARNYCDAAGSVNTSRWTSNSWAGVIPHFKQ